MNYGNLSCFMTYILLMQVNTQGHLEGYAKLSTFEPWIEICLRNSAGNALFAPISYGRTRRFQGLHRVALHCASF